MQPGGAVMAGLAMGTIITIVWELTPMISAFAGGLVATVIGSWMTRPPEDVDSMFTSMKGPQ